MVSRQPLAVHISSLFPTPPLRLSFARLIKYPSPARNQARWRAQSMPRFKPAATENPFRCRRRGTLLPHSPTHLVRLSCVGPLGEAARPQVEPGISLLLTEGRGSLTRPFGVKSSSPLLSLSNSLGSNQQGTFHRPRGQSQPRIRTLLSASLATYSYSLTLSLSLFTIMCESHSQVLRLSQCFSDILASG